ncbi:MAG: alcohol dehydrogenase catalytic domain-containing protein [Paracoccaceae bacterium]
MSHVRVILQAFGGPENLVLEAVADLPEPAAGEVRVRVLVTSAAFADVMIRKGMYPDVKDKPPFTPGYDMVGIVDALGPGATRFEPGARAAALICFRNLSCADPGNSIDWCREALPDKEICLGPRNACLDQAITSA